jgi:EAL domain-containing protein (putative c-di-GMP-specific phosphodiesterase class I)
VIEAVISQIETWRMDAVPVETVTVNATLADFRSPDFVDRILEAIAGGQIMPSEIGIEITEDVFLDDGMHCVRQEIERLHAAGICLIFDDFGTGYASLRHLREMPICAIKIDRSFVQNLVANDADRGLVEGILCIAHRLGRRVIAEGVETAAQLEILRDLGCDLVQGHLIAAALPPEGLQLQALALASAALPPVAFPRTEAIRAA